MTIADRSMTPAPMPRVVDSYTVQEKRELVELLLDAWLAAPDLRLGQLICCAVGFDKLLFGVSNIELHKLLAEFRERVRA